ncbi:MAG TPA: class I SAM-dependent methyltransferase [Bacteroidales bacterium]|nr:class I SAM-dependent methyltransferase [Bacteroidales bacterium]
MIDSHINNPKSPKYYINKWIISNSQDIKGKTVIDLPAGNGMTSEILKEHGAKVKAFDLFPEYFKVEEIGCQRADIMDGIPLENEIADLAICQEGIEHFCNQLKAFQEFNRVLKKGGRLLITTPSYSNLSAKFNYLIAESEAKNFMPPNEIDDIWMENEVVSDKIYYGHIFLIGLQKLRLLAKLAGFSIEEVKYIRLSKGSLLLLPWFYPIIYVSSWLRYYRNIKRNKNIPSSYKKQTYLEQLKMNISIKNLINHHSFIVFVKEKDLSEISFRNKSKEVCFDDLT